MSLILKFNADFEEWLLSKIDVKTPLHFRKPDIKMYVHPISISVLELLQMGVSAIICNTPSYITEQVANYANQMRVPVITPTATGKSLYR